MRTASGGICLLTGLEARRARALELNYDPKRVLRLGSAEGIPPDEVRLLAGYLETFSVPAGTMSPAGGWTAVYDILSFSTNPNYEKEGTASDMSNAILGQVAVTKYSPARYAVEMLYQPTGLQEHVQAEITCAADDLSSLQSYRMTWHSTGGGPRMAYTRQETGELDASGNLRIAVAGKEYTRTEPVSGPLTCLWTLFDAVRERPPRTDWRREFDMYLDLSSMRRRQQLVFSGTGRVPTATGTLNMGFYEQTGQGVIPIHYAVDGQRRTLFCTQGQLGWGLNRIEST